LLLKDVIFSKGARLWVNTHSSAVSPIYAGSGIITGPLELYMDKSTESLAVAGLLCLRRLKGVLSIETLFCFSLMTVSLSTCK
jgi:hypothetical protein